MQDGVRGAPHPGQSLDHASATVEGALVTRCGSQCRKMVGESADGRCVGAAVVVDDDHHRTVLACRDVVESFPTHSAGQRTVTDDGNYVAILTRQREGLREAVGIGQRGGSVRGLDPVVFALGAARIPGQSALLTQSVELILTTGEDLVYVGLMARVEDDRVLRRVENSVQCEGQLHDAQVGPEVTTGRSDLQHEELTNLVGQLRHLGVAQLT